MKRSLLTELDINELEDRIEFGICSGAEATASGGTSGIDGFCPDLIIGHGESCGE